MILWNIYLFRIPVSLHTTFKILAVSKMLTAFLYANELASGCQPLDGFKMGAGHWKDFQRGFQPHHPSLVLKVKLVASGQWFNQLCLCNETSMHSQKDRVWELPESWTCGGFWRVTHPGRAWKLHKPLPWPHLKHVFISLFCNILYSKQKVFF